MECLLNYANLQTKDRFEKVLASRINRVLVCQNLRKCQTHVG